jgi:hypothetical protein
MSSAPQEQAVSAGVPDAQRLREGVEQLSAIHRPTASEGEREAAAWVAARLAELGVEARLEEEPSNGGYWWPLGLMAGAGLLAGALALGGRRLTGAAIGAAACATAIDDLPPRSRRLRQVLPSRRAWGVLGELGPADAERTVVVHAHHDVAHPGLVFHPAIPRAVERVAPWAFEAANTSPPLMWPVAGASGVVAAGALAGSRRLTTAGMVMCAGVVAAMADIGARDGVPGANDNATGVVAMLGLAHALRERPPENLRVMLVSTSEEATCEGMHHFAERHFPSLPLDDTFFLCLDTVGSPHLCVLRGEGMFGITDYPDEALDLMDTTAEELGIWLYPNLRLRNATDGIYPLNAGYRCASLASCDRLKQPSNYHWPTDVAENVDYGTLADAVRLTEAVVRRLDERWF